jgi:hypothetical protein
MYSVYPWADLKGKDKKISEAGRTFITLQPFLALRLMMKQLRHFENFHIALWLIKDSCWLMHYKAAGVFMIVPTVLMALLIAVKTRHNIYLLLPNLAVCCWIFANAAWMLGEFYDFDHVPYALTFFLSGIVVIALYFIRYSRHEEPL